MKKIMERVINEITDHKAEADLIYSTSKALSMSAQNGEISSYKVSSSEILGVRVIKDGRVGISYTEALDDESLQFMIKHALQNAEISEPNANERILEMTGHLADEEKHPESEVDIATKTKKALELETVVKMLDQRVVSVPHNGFSENEYKSMYLSSRGRSTSYLDKSYSITSSALLDEKGKKAIYYDFNMAKTFEELQWNKVIETSLFHARNLLEEETLPSGKYEVKFTEDCLKDLLDCFANFYSAKSAMDKVNPWDQRVGSAVMSKDITIIDNPGYEHSFRTSLFDSEGVERKPLTLVKDGVLQTFYHNSMTANHFKTKTTGHASRSAGSSLGISGTDLMIVGKNKQELPQRYLEVIQMDGLYSGANRVKGTFSVAIKGYVWEYGERVKTFGNITLSGNVMDMFMNASVVGEGLEPSTDHSFFSVPLIFHNLSIAGS